MTTRRRKRRRTSFCSTQADAGQVNLTLILQHAPAQTEEDAPPRSAGEDASLRLAEQARPTLIDPTGGSKWPIADVVESESSGQPPKLSRVMVSR